MFHDLTERLERLHSSRLALRPVCLADGWPLFQATRHPAFNRHLAWEPSADEQPVLDRVNAIMAASRQGRLSAISAVLKTTGAWVSLFRFLPYGKDPRALELGIWTHPDYWQGRYSLELGQLCVDAAFEFTGIDRVVGLSLPENRGSCQLMQAVGMKEASRSVRKAEGGRTLNVIEYQLMRDDWLMRPLDELSFDEVECDFSKAQDLEKGYKVVDADAQAEAQLERDSEDDTVAA
jgi:RimJ/RimL family protein N-acetyltransferase